MKASGTPRSEIFYTTKLMENLGEKHVKNAIHRSLDLAGMDYMWVWQSPSCSAKTGQF